MKIRNRTVSAVASSLLATLLLISCSEKPEDLIASAKAYLAKNDSKAAVIQIKNALQADPSQPEARFLLGSALLASGDPVGAETELRKALDLKYPMDQVAPKLAEALLAQGQPKKVTEELSSVVVADPSGLAEMKTLLAAAYAGQGKTELAQGALNAALQADPNYAPALLVRAREKAGLRDFEGAMAIVDDVISKSPKNHEAWKMKGDLLLYAQDQRDPALQAYLKAVEFKPDFLAAHAAVTTLQLQQGKLDAASQQIELMKGFAANHPQTRFLQATLAYQQKDLKQARSLLQQVLLAAPTNVQALQLAGAVELQLNSPVQAEAHLSKALQLVPDLPVARRFLVVTYLRAGQTAKALETLLPGLNRDNVDPELLSIAGETYLLNGDVNKAEEYFSKAAAQSPDDARKRTSLAITHLMAGAVDSAFVELQNIAASDAGTTADMALVSAHLRRKDYDKALKAIDGLEKKQPGKPLAAVLRGRTLLAKRDTSGARTSFERAVELDPLFFPAVASLAALDFIEKKPDDARKRFEALVSKDPKNSQALLALAELAARSGAGKEEVVAAIKKAVAVNPTNAVARLMLIDYHLRNKDARLAIAAAQEGVTALPDSLQMLDALGRSQQVAGEFNQAVTTFNKLVAMQPNSPQPYMRLADVHMAAKDKVAAAASLRKALEIRPDLQQAQRGTIMLDVDGKNFKGAITTARLMQKQSPKDALGYVLEGDIHAAQKDWNSAASAYREGVSKFSAPELAIKLHSVLLAADKTSEAEKFSASWQKDHANDAAFLLYLGEGAIARKDYKAAEKAYLNIIKLQPTFAIAYNNLAWVTAKLGTDGAIAYAEKALELAPNQPAFMDTLAVLLSDKGDHAKAVKLQTEAIKVQPDNPIFMLNLAKIYIKGGNKALAKRELDELAKLGSKFGGQAEVSALLNGL
ncbi:XrtA/PEP-CTERM system TPR-repeat protein PrsT [Rhodoferax sp. PAMC 29310]|uniref:XrtA/PEP-CTERM system TPR-repeat protein PrsT n=1 Tax=Rhodoferax sp. PAMC 29310 TaxID=2822760 RepID=UPI001B32DC15|nr:XrtA/PEP-CTERM system TPR-repeat protein PrsT [Rhodoferax sp. PAMC 29310]